MHVKQVTTSQAFKWYPEKQLCVPRRKSFPRFSLHGAPGPAGYLRSQDSLFAYSTNLLQHITAYEQYSQRPRRTGSWRRLDSHVHPLNGTIRRWSAYSYVLSDGVRWQWTTGGLRYTIRNKLSPWEGRGEGTGTGKRQTPPQPLHTQNLFALFRL